MLKKMGQFVREEEGQGMAEYGLILAGVAVVAIVGIKALGIKIDEVIDTVTGKL
ncbi:Flp family type IVb pilin [Alkalihalobacillus hwajinpoensis]|uniref:Flp family type IVb pilin n=1 Tax=Guptibacillus hwajinpoensis TaxID=208199 RepID=UPI001884589C|nr:Flp family type IVb pilin [Pseudalkalibacillus hwajinpoensis]MBF0707913.1 Flp family type IVb pilin [Pseudalkalibacillus hwajinpoensis]